MNKEQTIEILKNIAGIVLFLAAALAFGFLVTAGGTHDPICRGYDC